MAVKGHLSLSLVVSVDVVVLGRSPCWLPQSSWLHPRSPVVAAVGNVCSGWSCGGEPHAPSITLAYSCRSE